MKLRSDRRKKVVDVFALWFISYTAICHVIIEIEVVGGIQTALANMIHTTFANHNTSICYSRLVALVLWISCSLRWMVLRYESRFSSSAPRTGQVSDYFLIVIELDLCALSNTFCQYFCFKLCFSAEIPWHEMLFWNFSWLIKRCFRHCRSGHFTPRSFGQNIVRRFSISLWSCGHFEEDN